MGRLTYKNNNICPDCGKTHFTSLENFIKKRYFNYTRAICEKSLEYESITYLSYQKKAEIIKLEKWNKIKPSNSILSRISGIYHYDEEFLHENGIKTVRLAIIDAVTNLIN